MSRSTVSTSRRHLPERMSRLNRIGAAAGGPLGRVRTERLSAAEPWLREHYAALLAEMGPRWEQTREVVAPAVSDAATKLRTEVAPSAYKAMGRLANETARRSAPIRGEAANRGLAAMAAIRGQMDQDELGRLRVRGADKAERHLKRWFFGSAAIGAAAAMAYVMWQRQHAQAWVEDDAEPEVPADGLERARTASEAGAEVEADAKADAGKAAEFTDPDDPADPEAGASTNRSAHARH